MTRTLFLHLGPAKTGTSAIQYALSRHDGSVVLYPNVGLWSDGSHHNLVLNFFGDHARPEMVREDRSRLLARIGEEARRSDRDLVISSEILAGRKNLPEFASALQEAVGEALRVIALVIVREHRERAASLYNQRVKDAVVLEQRSPDEFLVDHPERFCYAPLLRRLQKSGLELAILNYHPAGDLLGRCFGLFGFAPERIPEAPRRNVSLGRKALVATLAANRAAHSHEERLRFDSVLSRSRNRFVPSRACFTEGAVAEVRRMFAGDRKYLRREFGVRLPAPDRARDATALAIGEGEFAELAATMRDLGAYGGRISDALRSFVTSGPLGDELPAQ